MPRASFKLSIFVCLAVVSIIGAAHETWAQRAAARTIAQDCAADLTKFCRAITPGDGRKIACLISYSDKVTPRCRLTAFLAGKALANSMLSLERLSFQCGSDINSLCYKEPPGGGRIYDCLRKNRARLLPDCAKALPKFEAQFLRR